MMITMKRNLTIHQAWQEFNHAFWQLCKVLRRNFHRYCATVSRGYRVKNQWYFADRASDRTAPRQPHRQHEPPAKR